MLSAPEPLPSRAIPRGSNAALDNVPRGSYKGATILPLTRG